MAMLSGKDGLRLCVEINMQGWSMCSTTSTRHVTVMRVGCAARTHATPLWE
uniref:Uncharacterized protein n=1 Tax=Cucumis melo TaxID=3656 RepID=A0A9I9DH82_CUCME